MALADVAETWATEPTALVGCRTARARALVRLGDVRRADTLGREAVSLAEQTDSTDLRANALLHLAEVLRCVRPTERSPPLRASRVPAPRSQGRLRAGGRRLPEPVGREPHPAVRGRRSRRRARRRVSTRARDRRGSGRCDGRRARPGADRNLRPSRLRRRSPRRKRPRTNQEPSRDEPGSVADDRPPPPPIAETSRPAPRPRERARPLPPLTARPARVA
jgi:hypothetical protein